MKKSVLLSLLTCILFLSACNEDITVSNAVYFEEASDKSALKLTIQEEGLSTPINIRLVEILSNDVTVDVTVDTGVLARYNSRHGAGYLLPPTHLFKLDDNRVEIPAKGLKGKVGLTINPLDSTFDSSKKYAIPLKITSATGSTPLSGSDEIVIILDQIINTTVAYFPYGFNADPSYFGDNISTGAFTVEMLIQPQQYYGRNNISAFVFKDANNLSTIYSRFGGHIASGNIHTFMFRDQQGAKEAHSKTELEEGTWYHIALTYDGSKYTIYVNGQLETILESPSYRWDINQISTGNQNSSYGMRAYAAEFRFWSVARTQGELFNNMYVVDPTSPNLEVYYRINETSGFRLNDISGNERHGLVYGTITASKAQQFPPQL